MKPAWQAPVTWFALFNLIAAPLVGRAVWLFMQQLNAGGAIVAAVALSLAGTVSILGVNATLSWWAMREGLPKCNPVLLEPICKVEIDVPSEHTSKVNQIVSGRRGQLLGFDSKEGWSGWDTVHANLPQAEVVDLIIELRSLTQGTGTFRYEFDHLQELSGREAETVITQRQEAKAAA